MRQKRNYQILGDVELPEDVHALATEKMVQAEADLQKIKTDQQEVRVNFRWTKDKLDIVKQAAEEMGIPYQAYLKQVILRQSLADIQAITAAKRMQFHPHVSL
jgi:predicted DNA binding CopG/RHH family protein